MATLTRFLFSPKGSDRSLRWGKPSISSFSNPHAIWQCSVFTQSWDFDPSLAKLKWNEKYTMLQWKGTAQIFVHSWVSPKYLWKWYYNEVMHSRYALNLLLDKEKFHYSFFSVENAYSYFFRSLWKLPIVNIYFLVVALVSSTTQSFSGLLN